MKKSQIILGASAFILAVAGAFTTKASRFSTLIPAAIKPLAGGCQAIGNVNHVTVVKSAHLTAHTSLGSTMFTKSCVQTLFTDLTK